MRELDARLIREPHLHRGHRHPGAVRAVGLRPLVAAGVRSILNFAPAVLSVPVRRRRAPRRPLDRAADPRLPRAAQGARRRPPRIGGRVVSLLVIGLSHHTAPLAVLEALAEHPDRSGAIATAALSSATATEVVVLSTCNRLEVYAEVPTFHGAVAAIGEALALAAGVSSAPRSAAPSDDLPHRAEVLADHLYVRHDEGAVAHAFTVACGLDSMAVGEAQVLGQMRDALAVGPSARAGRRVAQLALPAGTAGRQARSPRDRHRPAQPLARADRPRAGLPSVPRRPHRRSAAVVGAGSMSGLAAVTTAGGRHRVAHHREPHRGARASGSPRPPEGAPGRGPSWPTSSPRATSSSPAPAPSGTSSRARPSPRSARLRGGRPQVVVDLALPRDVAPADDVGHGLPPASRSSSSSTSARLLEGRADRTRGRARR